MKINEIFVVDWKLLICLCNSKFLYLFISLCIKNCYIIKVVCKCIIIRYRPDHKNDIQRKPLRFNRYKMVKTENTEHHNKATWTTRDVAMLLLRGPLRRMLWRSAHSKRFGNRRQPIRGAENNDPFARGRSSYKRILAHKWKKALISKSHVVSENS